MKFSKNEALYFLASLLLIGLFGYIYLTNKPETVRTPNTKQELKTSSVSTYATLKKQLEGVAANPTQAALDAIKPNIDKIKDSKEHQELLTLFEKLSTEVNNITAAETALSKAQDNPTSELLSQAQELIEKVTTASKKQDLQNRINALIANKEQNKPTSSNNDNSDSNGNDTPSQTSIGNGASQPVNDSSSDTTTAPVNTTSESTTTEPSVTPSATESSTAETAPATTTVTDTVTTNNSNLDTP